MSNAVEMLNKITLKLTEEKEELIKLRNRESKKWKKDTFYYYQGKIDEINKIIEEIWKYDHCEKMNVVHDFNDYLKYGDVYGKNR